jgi:putative flippase GtrA
MSILLLLALAAISFIQNMAFTFTSRSRNSGDPQYHRYASWGSNGIWLLNQIFLVKIVWEPVMDGNWIQVIAAGIVYIIFTTEGSVAMMKIMLGIVNVPFLSKWFTEKGDRKVGSDKKP